jgi:hypothetical protein
MTKLSQILQICCILAIAVGTFFAAAAYMDLCGLPQDWHDRRNGDVRAFGFGLASLALGALGLLTIWVNAIVFSRRQRPSDSGNPCASVAEQRDAADSR